MNVVRWILSYSGVIVVLVAVALGYVYREEIAAWFDASERQVSAPPPEDEALEGEAAAPEALAAEEAESGTPSAQPEASVADQPPLAEAPAPASPAPPGPAAESAPTISDSRSYVAPSSPGVNTPVPGAAINPPPRPPGVPPGAGGGLGYYPPPPSGAPRPDEREGGTAASPQGYGTPAPRMAQPPRAGQDAAPPGYAPPWPPRAGMPAPMQRPPVPQGAPGPRAGGMPAPPSRPAPPPDPRLDAAPPELAEGDRRALLEARTRFWREGPQAALEDYSELAGRLADHPDVIGELGNLHMLLRQPEAAAEQYARAAELLQAAGRPAQARDTARLVGRLDPQRARELLETLSGDDGA